MERCDRCGALLTADLNWCGQCYAPVTRRPQAEPAEASYAWAGPLARIPEVDPDPVPAPRYSRWKSGPTTYGPVLKVVITLVMALLGFVTWYMFRFIDGPVVVADVGVYAAIALWVLHHVWRRDRVG